LMIAAIALANQMTLVTHINPSVIKASQLA